MEEGPRPHPLHALYDAALATEISANNNLINESLLSASTSHNVPNNHLSRHLAPQSLHASTNNMTRTTTLNASRDVTEQLVSNGTINPILLTQRPDQTRADHHTEMIKELPKAFRERNYARVQDLCTILYAEGDLRPYYRAIVLYHKAGIVRCFEKGDPRVALYYLDEASRRCGDIRVNPSMARDIPMANVERFRAHIALTRAKVEASLLAQGYTYANANRG